MASDRAGAQPFGSEECSEVPSSSQPAEVSSSGADVIGAASGAAASQVSMALHAVTSLTLGGHLGN